MKHKTRTKALSWLLSLALALSLLPGMSLTAEATDTYDLYVGGTQVTGDNPSGDNWSYDASTNTLTLDGFTYSGTGYERWYSQYSKDYSIIFANQDLKIILKNENSVVCTQTLNSYGIRVNGNLTIESDSGTGSLSAKGKSGIYSTGDLTVVSGSVTADGGIRGGNVTISGGTVNATGTNCIEAAPGNVTISGGTVNATGTYGVNAGSSNGNVTINADAAVTVSGSIKAIQCKVINAIAGTGWSNQEGTEGRTVISVSTEGQTLAYKKVQFPPDHTHDFGTSYALSTVNTENDTITATCGAEDCTLTDSKATLTIAPSSAGGYGAVLSGDAAVFGVTDSDIEYSSDGTTWSTTVPTQSGSYQARITVTDAADNTKTYTATVRYGVSAITTEKTYTAENDHGTVSVPEVAGAGATVTINTTPEAGYALDTLTVTKTGGTETVDVTKNGNNGVFTMPDDAVTVSATFAPRSVPVKLNVAGNSGTTCEASLLTESFAEVDKDFTQKAGDKFALRISTDDVHDYKIAFNEGINKSACVEVFSAEDNQRYIAYAKENNISVPANTDLFWVTTPGLAAGDLNITVTFATAKTFAILYQPTASADEVWCKFTSPTDVSEKPFAVKMKKDAVMGNDAVWSVKVTAAFNPTQIAFVTTESDLESATMSNAIVTQNTSWSSITGGQYLIIGGNAKTVVAAFVSDASAVPVYNSETATFSAGANTNGVNYQIAVCGTDGSGKVTTAGSVTAPAAPAKTGYTFDGWRGFAYDAYGKATETVYSAGTQISVRENTTFNAVWHPERLSVTLHPNGGLGGGPIPSVPYGQKLTISENPTREGYAFDGWTVSKTVTQSGELFVKGSPFDFNTPITDNLELAAKWKHTHSYAYAEISDDDVSLARRKTDCHIAICICGKSVLEAHSFDSDGRCTACGYQKPEPQDATLVISYEQWNGNEKIKSLEETTITVDKNKMASAYAPGTWGTCKFSKWECSTDDGATWSGMTANALAVFPVPGNMKLRAIYMQDTGKPQVSLSARRYVEKVTIGNATYDVNNVLVHMDYKLPAGYTYVDAGVRLGDNPGICYYELKERKRTAGEKALTAGLVTGVSVGLGLIFDDGLFDAIISGADAASSLESNFYYDRRENSVLDEMSAESLSKYLYEGKPINVEKSRPIYWDYSPITPGQSGSLNALTPVNFIIKNDGNHWIYGIGWLRYKTPDGTTQVIYTPALATTRDDIPTNPVTKQGS